MEEIVFISTNAVTYEQVSDELKDAHGIEYRVTKSAIGSKELVIAFAFTADIFRKVMNVLRKHMIPKGSILLEVEVTEKGGKKTKRKLEVKGTELSGAVDVAELWKQLK